MRNAIGYWGAAVLLVLGMQSPAARAADESKPGQDYYPMKAGSKWIYSGDVNGQKISMTNQIAKIENIDGVSLSRLETLNAQMAVVANEHLASTAKGVFRHRINGIESDPPFCILKYPVKSGETWKVDSKVGNDVITGSCTVEKEEVTVPAGKYTTMKVTTKAEVVPSGQKVDNTVWLAPGVGIVKQKTDLGAVTISLELEKFEAGK